MNGFLRVFPYIWPYRRKLILSVLFGVLVAVLWGLNLTAVLPVVEVLFREKSLAQYVDQEIATAEDQIRLENAKLAEFDQQLAALEPGNPDDDDDRALISKRKAKEISKLSRFSRKLMILQWAKSVVIPYVPRDQFDTFALLLAVLLAATLLKGICIFLQDVLVGGMVELATMSLRKDCFRHTLGLDYQTLRLSGTSDLMSRFTYDMSVLVSGLTLLGGKVIREPLKAAVCILAAWCLVSWQLTLLSLLFAPLAGVVFYRIGRKMKQASKRVMESMSRIYKTLEETFDSAKIVIAFGGAKTHRQRFHRENKEYLAKALRIVRIDALTSPVTEVLGLLAAFIAVLPGAYLVLRGTTSIWGIRLVAEPIEVSDLALLYAFLAGVIDPARKLSTVYAKLKRSSAAADRIFALLEYKPLVKEAHHPRPLSRHARDIEFRKVHFTYATHSDDVLARPAVLEDVSLKIQFGETVAIVGENGSGKSTLVNLLPRFFDPDHGSVRIDGVDIREARLRDLRGQIGVVTQETLLFDATILENIRYGRPDATRAEIEAAARKAHVTPFVEQLPGGLETSVGEKGGRLSGGQRQRIALARAMLRDPAILILDEATSAIDAQSEQLIYQALQEFARGRTTFIITHAVTPNCLNVLSRIVVMDQGRVAAVGTHAELLETCPAYQRLYRAQVRVGPDSAETAPAGELPGMPPPRQGQRDGSAVLRSGGHSAGGSMADNRREQEPHILPLRPAAAQAVFPQACGDPEKPGHSSERAV